MSLIETVFTSGYIGWVIIVPILRAAASIFAALAVSKDSKARNNGSSILWGLAILLSPVLFGIIYFVYSRFLSESKPDTIKDKKYAKQSKRLFILAVFTYLVMAAMLIISIILIASSGIAGIESGDFIPQYYDINGIEYDKAQQVPLYDEEGNTYKIAKSDDGINYYPYFDQNGVEYDLDKTYISQDGYFYYDKDNELIETDELFYYDKHFYDEKGNIYAKIDECAYWDGDGNICIVYIGAKTRYAFKD